MALTVRVEVFNPFNRNESLSDPATGSPATAPTRSPAGLLTGGFGYVNYTAITSNSVGGTLPIAANRTNRSALRILIAIGVTAAAVFWLRAFAPAPAIQFEEIAQKAGLLFQLRNGEAGKFHQIELMGGGVAVLDYNNDGCADIFFTNGAAIPGLNKSGPEFCNRLYRNNCDMTFTDVTEEAGLAGEGYSMAVAAADFDNDGFTDIFVAGVDRNMLYRNLGNGHFIDVTQKAGVGGGQPKAVVRFFGVAGLR